MIQWKGNPNTMKAQISAMLEKIRYSHESEEMCYIAINGGFEFEIKNKLAFWLEYNNNDNNSIFFLKEAKIGRCSENSKIIDIISILPNETLNQGDIPYIDGEKKHNKIWCSIEIGHNYLSQPVGLAMNKTRTDIAKCFKAGVKSNLFNIQIITDITRINEETARFYFKSSYLRDVKKHISNKMSEKKIEKIIQFYKAIDQNYNKLTFLNNWNGFNSTIFVFILEPSKLE